MLNEDHTAELSRVFTDVLEQLAFMFADPPEDELPPAEEGLARASMTFHGPFSGELTLTVPREMAPVLAANVLGLEPDDELVLQAPYDALKELLNVTCGNVLTAIAGDEPIFDLSVPAIEELPEDSDWDLDGGPNTVACLVDDFPVVLRLKLTDG